MSVPTTRPPELDELDRIRLDEDLTFRDLEAAIGVSAQTLNRLLTVDTAIPYDRTLHKIRRYLDSRTARQPKSGRRYGASA